VALEFARSHLLSGFGWNLLAYSQAPWPAFIQLARETGCWGVSFAVALVNALVAAAYPPQTSRRRRLGAMAAAVLVIGGMASGGLALASAPRRPGLDVAVVQGNIPQEEKWDEAYTARIQEQYARLTREAAALRPALIIWPETSVPGYFGVEEEVTRPVVELARAVRAPLLLGTPYPRWTPEGMLMTNRATLVDDDGEILES
jgi:apolipoprotein N-acyltransferase